MIWQGQTTPITMIPPPRAWREGKIKSIRFNWGAESVDTGLLFKL